MDVRNCYRDAIIAGCSNEEAVGRVGVNWGNESELDQEDVDVILGLAAAQIEVGRLDESIRRLAINCIGSGLALSAWVDADGDSAVREPVLQEFLEQLQSIDCTRQKPKKIRSPFRMTCDWAVGDCLAYKLTSGRYLMLVVISIQDIKDMGCYPSVAWSDCVFNTFEDLHSGKDAKLATLYWWLPGSVPGLTLDTINRTYLYEKASARKPADRLIKLPFKRDVDSSMKSSPIGFMFWTAFEDSLLERYPHLN